jgi:Ni/Fe-hydrogenase subunit HybB-like protein
MVVLGVVLNRMNVSITGLERYAGRTYFPSWIEIAVTLSIVVVGFIAFALAVRYLPVFTHHGGTRAEEAGEASRRQWAQELSLASRGR